MVVAAVKVDLTLDKRAGMRPGSGSSAKAFGKVVRPAVEEGRAGPATVGGGRVGSNWGRGSDMVDSARGLDHWRSHLYDIVR